MTNLKNVLFNFEVKGSGFPAVEGLRSESPLTNVKVVVSTLPAAQLAEQGVKAYFAPQFERGQVFENTEELVEANVPVNFYVITEGEKTDETIIVSRHTGTVEILSAKYPNAEVYDGLLDKETVKDKHVVGTLPPHLVSECALYTHVSIKDFDYTKDGDISGEELNERLVINKSIGLDMVEVRTPIIETVNDLKHIFDNSTCVINNFMYSEDAEKYGSPLRAELDIHEVAYALGFKTFPYSYSYEVESYSLIINPKDVDDYMELYTD